MVEPLKVFYETPSPLFYLNVSFYLNSRVVFAQTSQPNKIKFNVWKNARDSNFAHLNTDIIINQSNHVTALKISIISCLFNIVLVELTLIV